MATPDRDRRRRAASRFGLRPTRLAATKDLHQLLGHQPVETESFRWWIVDERTRKRRLTAYQLTRADAERAFPGAEPDLQTREVRDLPNPDRLPASSRPEGDWS